MSDEVLSSSWCTAWQSYNTPRLWAMVADEDDPEAWRQVAAWDDISGSVKDQRAMLVKAKEDLVAAWPPEQNKSSAAFVQELDTLIARMDAARVDADQTATGLANILEALRQAKNNIQPLYEQYKEKNDDIWPSWWDNAEDEIDEQARKHMITAEGIVQENVARLKVPDPYELKPQEPKFEKTPPGGDPRQPHTRSGSDTGSSSDGHSRASGPVSVPHDPPPPMPGRDETTQDGVTGPGATQPGGGPSGGGSGSVVTPSGPGLAGVITPPGVTPADTLPPGGGPFPGTGGGAGPVTGGGSGVLPPGVVPPGQIGSGGGSAGVSGVGRGVSGAGRGGVRVPTGAGRALPSGAVIGESVAGGARGPMGGVGGVSGRGAGAGRVGGPGGMAGRGGAAGSVGGVAGRGGAAGRGAVAGRGGMTGRAGAVRGAAEPARPPRPSWLPEEPAGTTRPGTGPTGMSGAARGARRSGDGSQPEFDPDNPWQVAEGVDPVIAPSTEEATHDPGPNVIGWRG
ncbi:hypothetical protein [Nucisporomicrobium flavum]|uniref:hypothetical protein n=1 Tax=Nucisporomicrobium flavum TaxID=2785915 RepID=UPI0018F36AF6|nr:hypothetical protein [Nucisporomicrobium flavum]